MFNCYAHGWSSHAYVCPACTIYTSSSSSVLIEDPTGTADTFKEIDVLRESTKLAYEMLNAKEHELEEANNRLEMCKDILKQVAMIQTWIEDDMVINKGVIKGTTFGAIQNLSEKIGLLLSK